MNYWIFQSVAAQNNLRTKLEEGKDEVWLASRYRQQMSAGDLVFFWLGGKPNVRGIYGWGSLLSGARLGDEQEYEVRVHYDKRLTTHLTAERILRTSELRDLLISRQAMGTNFMLSREQAQAIASLMDPADRPHIPPVPNELFESIRTGECVLFAGAGLSARAGVPTWTQFLGGLLNFAVDNEIVDPSGAESFRAALETGDRNAVADGLVHAFGKDRDVLEEFLRKTFPEPVALPTAHELVRQIPFAAVVTTNYDGLLERTFPEYAAAGLYTPKDAGSLLDAHSQNRRYILKLYGTVQDPETLILAPIEYQEAVSSNLSFAKFVEGLFFSKSFFFVGLSLEGIQDYLSGFVFRGAIPRKHFALVAVAGTAWKTKAEFLERRFNVRVIDYPISKSFPEVDTFLEELRKRAIPVPSMRGVAETVSAPVPGIREIILEDIGSFERLELDFKKDKWKILLGDNGVGKSTVLKAIAVAIIGVDARSYAGRLVRAGKTKGRITIRTDRNPNGYITEILTKDMLSDSEVVSIPTRCMEAEGWLALGFSPLRSVTWTASTGPQQMVQKGRPTADDLIPLLSGETDPRMDRLKQWIVNLDAADRLHPSTLQGHRDRVASLAFTTDGSTLISGSIDGTVRFWDSWTGQELRKIDAHTDGINAVAVTTDGKVAISGSFDRTIKSWNVETGRPLRTFAGSRSQILAVSVSTKARIIASGSEGGSIRLWDLDKGTELRQIACGEGSVWSVAVSGNGKTVVGGCDGGTIKSYDVASGRELSTLRVNGGAVWSIALGADERTLVSGGEDGAVSVWDLGTGSQVRTLRAARSAGILSVAVSADGQTIASGAEDGRVTVWALDSRLELVSLQAHTRGVWSVALSSDRRIATSGSDDKSIKLWSMPVGNAVPRQRRTIEKLFEVIASLTDRNDIDFLRVTENYRVLVKVAEAPDGVPLELLSQGQTSLFGWVGHLCQRLKETTQDSNIDPLPTDGYALVLIDEVDAHMHPRWQQVLVRRLKQVFPNVQFIASTHSPLIIGGLDTSEVVRFERDASGLVQLTRPKHALKGMGAAGLLTSELFGLTSQLDSETAEALDRKRQLTAMQLHTELTDKERAAIKAEIESLEEQVKYVDSTKFVRDPLYSQFVEAMSRVKKASEQVSMPIVLTPEQKKQKAQIAEEIVRKLVRESEGQ